VWSRYTGKERDAESGLDDFGARYYAGTMGRFMSPDMVDPDLRNPQSLNMYRYAFNNPLRYYDPDGLYERDVHFDLTRALAYAAGYSSSQSLRIAGADQGVDDSKTTGPFAGYSARRDYHFTTHERRAELWNSITGTEEGLGVYLHPEQDSFSHAGYGPRFGHLFAGHAPDKTYLNPIKADDMAMDTYGALQEAGANIGTEFRAVPYSRIQPFVQAFNRATTPDAKNSQLDLLRLLVDQFRRDAEQQQQSQPRGGVDCFHWIFKGPCPA
jgi:RHS repeat-associated protein